MPEILVSVVLDGAPLFGLGEREARSLIRSAADGMSAWRAVRQGATDCARSTVLRYPGDQLPSIVYRSLRAVSFVVTSSTPNRRYTR